MFREAGLGIAAVGCQEQEARQTEYAVKVAVDSVFFNVSVQERNTNRSLAGLKKEDFLVYEDGVPQEVQQLNTEDAPVNALLLLDNSGSTKAYLGLIKDAATEFTHRMKPADQIAVALENARLFQQTQAALKELDSTNRLLVREGWQDYLGQSQTRRRAEFRGDVTPPAESATEPLIILWNCAAVSGSADPSPRW
jgi:hypothetical protein